MSRTSLRISQVGAYVSCFALLAISANVSDIWRSDARTKPRSPNQFGGPATHSTRRILCLADSGLISQAAARVKEKYGAAPTLLVSFRQLRQQPGLALRLPLRRFDVAMAVLTDIEVPLYRDFILTYLFVLRAKRKVTLRHPGGEISVGSREGLRAVLHCFADLAGLPLGTCEPGSMRDGFRTTSGVVCHAACRRRVAYLRANPWQESRAGGAVAHTAGVLSGLRAAEWEVTFAGTNDVRSRRTNGIAHPCGAARYRWLGTSRCRSWRTASSSPDGVAVFSGTRLPTLSTSVTR